MGGSVLYVAAILHAGNYLIFLLAQLVLLLSKYTYLKTWTNSTRFGDVYFLVVANSCFRALSTLPECVKYYPSTITSNT